MKNDSDLQHDVMDELEWEPSLDAAGIGVAVNDGTVTLTGHVSSWAERSTAQDTARRVEGVRAVANDLKVEVHAGELRDDTDLAQEAVRLLDAAVDVPWKAVTVTVHDGWLTLEGDVPWNYQREAASRSVRYIRGVRAVTNRIAVKPEVSPANVQEKIEEALQRAASLDAKQIHVETIGGRVILRGTVRSFAERGDAELAAWSAPGVTSVDDEIVVGAVGYAAT